MVFHNVGGLPQLNQHPKNDQWRRQLEDLHIDTFAACETNINWVAIPFTQRLPERTRGWFESIHWSIAFNRHEPADDPHVYGGSLVLTRNRATHRIIAQGQDPSGLGRWAWTQFRGRQGRSVRVVSVYKPAYNPTGPSSTFNQHRRFLLSQNSGTCPREDFNRALLRQTEAWLQEGDQLIIGGDFNEDIRGSSLSKSLSDLGLVEQLGHRHGPHAPPTYARGSKPIDGIFVTQSLVHSRCGHLEWGVGITSDHVGVWIDVPYSVLFGCADRFSVSPRARRLQCRDPRTVDAYNHLLWEALSAANLPQRAATLESQMPSLSPEQQLAAWDALDKERVRIMLHSEKKCRKLRMGHTPWSPTLQKSTDAVTFWQLKQKKLKGLKVSSRLLLRKQKAAGLEAVSCSLHDVGTHLRDAWRQYRSVKKEAVSLRQGWIESLAAARATAHGGSVPAHLAQMLRVEVQRREGRLCRAVVGRAFHGRVQSVEARSPTGEWMACETKESIEQACLSENLTRFRQASSTPFLVPPLSQILDPLALNSQASHILEGTFSTWDGLDRYTARLIRALARPPTLSHNLMEISLPTETHTHGWAKVREHTTSGFSGVHFGHFMAGSRHSQIATFESTMARMPLQMGFAPTRWRRCLDMAILKAAGNYKVESLRTILLLAADFNQLNKLIGQRLMQHAEKFFALAPEQYGCRVNKSAAEHALNKRLVFDLARQTRTPFALCANDAKSCYDRIIWSVASLAMQRVGVPPSSIAMMLQTLRHMKHHVRTVHGDSKNSFDCGDYDDVHGVGQGNGASPAIWTVVSTPLLNIQREEGFGARFSDPFQNEFIHLAGFSYVDDTDLCQNGPLHSTEVIAQLQHSLDCWEGTLRATGGGLVPQKSFWVNCSFKWTQGRWRYATSTESPGELRMKDSTGVAHRVERIEPQEGRRTLGVRLAADGNNKAEGLYLRQCCLEWADRVRTRQLPRHLAWRSLSSMLWPKLLYPLPATTFTRHECKKIMAPALRSGLAAAGMVGSLPRALVHGPIAFGGLGLWDLFHSQGWSHLMMLLRHGPNPLSITGRLLRCSIQQAKWELGLPGGLFLQDFNSCHHLVTESWVKSLWYFVHTYGIQVHDPLPNLELQREHDIFIIQSFLSLGYKGGDLSSLNRCRLFLQIHTLSDITSGCGRYLSRKAWQGHYDPDLPRSSGWPVQPNPPRSDWSIWQHALQRLCRQSSLLALPRRLHRWLQTVPPLLAWQFSPSQQRLFRQIAPQTWVFHIPTTSRSGRSAGMRFDIQGHHTTVSELPLDLERGHASIHRGHIYFSGSTPSIAPAVSPPLTPFQCLISAPLTHRWAWGHLNSGPAVENVLRHIQDRTCKACSDGSYKDGCGGASWTIGTYSERDMLQGLLRVPGSKEVQCALRSELAGLYGIILAVSTMFTQHPFRDGMIEVGCDSKQALSLIFSTSSLPPSTPHLDLIAASQNLLRGLPILWTPRYIPVHQDDSLPSADWWTLTNCSMDRLAKSTHHLQLPSLPPDVALPGETWYIVTQNSKWSTLDKALFIETVSAPPTKSYWEKKWHVSPSDSGEIAWQEQGIALQEAKLSRRTWVIKMASGFSATGKQMHRWKQWNNDHCPRCGASEDIEHVLRCPSTSANHTWDQSLRKLEQGLDQLKTPFLLTQAIITSLRQWRDPQTPVNEPTECPELADAMAHQSRIGWQAGIFGWLSLKWSHSYYQRQTPSVTQKGKRWTVALIKHLWNTDWDMWADRNGYLHSSTSPKHLDDLIRAQYTDLPQHPSVLLRSWFELPLGLLLTKTRKYKKAWLRHVLILRGHGAIAESRSLSTSRAVMRKWLQGGS